MQLEGKVAVVTGAGRGIGYVIASTLAKEGARVAVNDIEANEAREAAAAIVDEGYEAETFPANIADSSAVRTMFENIKNHFGTVDILVNNAGIGGRGDVREISDELWREVMAVNLDATFYCTREAAKTMVEKGSGYIVNMSSNCGVEGCTFSSPYSTSKAAVLGFTKAIARDLGQYGVIVNALAPGLVETPGLSTLPPAIIDGHIARAALGRVGRSEEIANLVVYLVSGKADYIVGQVISPNGGTIM